MSIMLEENAITFGQHDTNGESNEFIVETRIDSALSLFYHCSLIW